ncbi:MAG: hypothetical protein JGK17_21295 [Microcoleus sp. PH2017_10_PVI_O_A]|uniref:hypothetical protein n=1 Tax=unclassified Microcoleus TaxID=2642155 RepID=UPI001DEE7628|nr:MULTISPECIES: hypothetical protein [unclassified Microcoleus]MCC3408073.1 hypothetical protein [Microcoleus sp. PH2017_10_PVI_O_A]MCC3462193.1 hypothetical protein [Microcoleus sp. PH2017_11_PCY_U_A]MCC3480624.1 hypothetical protein [Microcoleus sp. PH2017_12_PCY_D_A]MCC3531322.1 hypothetical protein [Microcoleus sp. PH2017_21_RUC_O_A]MCC3544182.1 hypothetical protein [Microcoleus sp. PH2017_22_RUC_O_B]
MAGVTAAHLFFLNLVDRTISSLDLAAAGDRLSEVRYLLKYIAQQKVRITLP